MIGHPLCEGDNRDRYVSPEGLTAGLAQWLLRRGVEIVENTEVMRVTSRNQYVQVGTSVGSFGANAAIVCPGVYSPHLLNQLGVRTSIVSARGYSVTIANTPTSPTHALYLAEAKVGVSAYDGSVRIAGVFELGQRDETLDRKRLSRMLTSVEPYFTTWRPRTETPVLEWVGLRPMTSDGLPLIGRAPALSNVFIAAGHGMLGVTLAPATAACSSASCYVEMSHRFSALSHRIG